MRFSVNLGNPFICKVHIVRRQEKMADIKSWRTLESLAVFRISCNSWISRYPRVSRLTSQDFHGLKGTQLPSHEVRGRNTKTWSALNHSRLELRRVLCSTRTRAEEGRRRDFFVAEVSQKYYCASITMDTRHVGRPNVEYSRRSFVNLFLECCLRSDTRGCYEVAIYDR